MIVHYSFYNDKSGDKQEGTINIAPNISQDNIEKLVKDEVLLKSKISVSYYVEQLDQK